ncbi:MAG: 16S rRNA (cytosine(967)-C(5))-methyltransferase RsmB [Deltaproteobacteria bacterium]|nr:16S rRNA (cytosine(967)-C(5))-methyltransferase RsmB [Deltaproteobacteria bacterium]
MTKQAKENARRIAFDALTAVRKRDAFVGRVLDADFERRDATSYERRLAVTLANGVLRHRRWLDWHIDRVSKMPIRKIEPAVLDALRLGLFQITHLDNVPDHVAVNETVALAPQRARGFVNATLKTFVRERDAAGLPPIACDTPVETLAVRTSHPTWLAEKWIAQFGMDDAARILEADCREPEPVFRIAHKAREAVIAELTAANCEAIPTTYSPVGIIARPMERVLRTPPFEMGRLTVQGEASQIVTLLLDPKPGQRVLDLCAAPGGKSTHSAELVGPTGSVLAADLQPHRLELVTRNAKRLGLKNIETRALDASKIDEMPDGPFERVLVDAPCSSLGQLAKNPETKWRVDPSDPPRLFNLQNQILKNAASRLLAGGRLVFAVCTLTDEETHQVVEAFLKEHADFAKVAAETILPETCRPLVHDGYLRILPGEGINEGFFAAAFEKR